LQLFLNCGLLFALLKTVLLGCSIFVSCIWFGNLRTAHGLMRRRAVSGLVWQGGARISVSLRRWRMHGTLYLFRALTDSTAPQKVPPSCIKGNRMRFI
jgi:hypothetical protein